MRDITGAYKTNGRTDAAEAVVITRLSETQYRVENPCQWDGVGIFDGAVYCGVFRCKATIGYAPFRGAWGFHEAHVREDGSFAVHGRCVTGEFGDFDVVWVPDRRSS